ncbi:MAG: hypothetical protein RI539_08130, partial [Spiribacter sp.]|nr:hypothetical protein [Spiribacter sp.]
QDHIDDGFIDIQTTRNFTRTTRVYWYTPENSEYGNGKHRLEQFVYVDASNPNKARNSYVELDAGDGQETAANKAIVRSGSDFTLYAQGYSDAAYLKFYVYDYQTETESLLGIGHGRNNRYFSMHYDGPSLADGSYRIRATAVDRAGNESGHNGSTYQNLTVETDTPAVPDV